MSNTTKIRATFCGTASLGYEPGEVYTLFIENKKSAFGFKEKAIVIRDADTKNLKTKICEYDSIGSFIANWTHIVPVMEPGFKANLYNRLHALTQTNHPRVIFALQAMLEIEKGFLKAPSTRFKVSKIKKEGVTVEELNNSRKLAEESIAQGEQALKLLTENRFVVGRDDLMEALQNYAMKHSGAVRGHNPDKFAIEIIEDLEEKMK